MRLFVLIAFIICSSCASKHNLSQETRDKNDTKSSINKYQSASKRIIYEAYKEYVRLAPLLDDGRVTQESVLDFKLLFESGARVWNDIQLYDGPPQLIDAEYYADMVSTYLSRNGIKTELEVPSINVFFSGANEQYNPKEDFADADDHIFYYTYRTIKKNYNILNKNNQELTYDEAMEFPIEITFRISINNQSAEIVSIYPDKAKMP